MPPSLILIFEFMNMKFLKTSVIAVLAAIFMVGCQKDNGPGDTSQPEQGVGLKFAQFVDDYRDWGSSTDWSDIALSFLQEGKNLPNRHPEFFPDNVPSGIKVIRDSYVYLTFVSQVAAYNNVLGYYFYNENQLSGDYDTDRAFILSQIFTTDSNNELNMNQVVFSSTKGMYFGNTVELSNDGAKFAAGTIIGFYLLPNRGKGESPVIWTKDGKVQFICTDKSLNTTVDSPLDGKISHIMGKTACDDLTIAFEDLNSLVSKSSDEDYNDLVFVVSDNLNVRQVLNIEPYNSESETFELEAVGESCPMHTEKLTLISWNNGRTGINGIQIAGYEVWKYNERYLSDEDFEAQILVAPSNGINEIFTFKQSPGKVYDMKVAIYDGSWKVYIALAEMDNNGGSEYMNVEMYRIR